MLVNLEKDIVIEQNETNKRKSDVDIQKSSKKSVDTIKYSNTITYNKCISKYSPIFSIKNSNTGNIILV